MGPEPSTTFRQHLAFHIKYPTSKWQRESGHVHVIKPYTVQQHNIAVEEAQATTVCERLKLVSLSHSVAQLGASGRTLSILPEG